MGKPSGKKKLQARVEKTVKQNKAAPSDRTSKQIDEDASVFIQMSQEMMEEGNKLFQKHDSEGAMLKYEKALKLLPVNHIDAAYLRSKMAACYMQFGLKEYPRAIQECNLALEVAPKYSKALLMRARCYEALNKFDCALRDVKNVLSMEPNNLAALEIEDSVKQAIERKGQKVEDIDVALPHENIKLDSSKAAKVLKEKVKKKKSNSYETKKDEDGKKEGKVTRVNDMRADEKVVVEDKRSVKEEKVVTRTMKLVLGDDIRWAQLPVNCSIGLVREVVRDRFPGLDGVLLKYKDKEGDLITIITTAELRLAEASSDPQGVFRLYLVEVSADKEPVYDGLKSEQLPKANNIICNVSESVALKKSEETEERMMCMEEWIVQFARLFKNHVGFDSNPYLDLHELGMQLYSEAMEDTVTTESSQNLFDIAGLKFQEMTALALFNWGNIHMNKARKLVVVAEDGSKESLTEQLKVGYEWAQKEYRKAEARYAEALKVKPDFYEGHLALGQQQFEQAKLSWYYALGTKTNLEEGPYAQVLDLYNKAEDNMEKGMQMWEEFEERRLNGLSISDEHKAELVNVGLEGTINHIPADEAAEQAVNIRSQIYILWGTLLYERSVVEFKLSLPSWEECLEVSIEKFELAGASPTDITVIIKNHCCNGTALEGLSYKINEIVQAWNEMFDTKRCQTGVPSFRLEPLFRRRISKLHTLMEHF